MTDLTQKEGSNPGIKWWLPIALLIFAAALRIWSFPAKYEIRDVDELTYVSSGLVAWEGLPPTDRAVPAFQPIWTGWLYIAGRSALEGMRLLHERETPTVLKPFRAIDAALFKTYQDLGGLRLLILWISFGIALLGVYCAYRLGRKYGGMAGGVFTGGLVAVLPLFIDYIGISKSCSDAWMLGIASIGCATTIPGAARKWTSGILLGLSIASRIDMVLLGPVVLWMLWDDRDEESEDFGVCAVKTVLISVATAALAAPWVMTSFVGTLRTVCMARVVGYWSSESPRLTTLRDLCWSQGLGPVLLVSAAGFLICSVKNRKRLVLAAIALLMAATMFGSHYNPIRYQGGPLIVLLVFAAVNAGALLARLPVKAALPVAALLIALPAVQAVRATIDVRSYYEPEAANDWIEQHIPAGTIVYCHTCFTVRALVSTEAAADATWHLVAGEGAWRTKLEDGFRRFSLPKEDLPRAMSEDNLAMDRGNARRWFILGGGRSSRPRYEIRPYSLSPTFGWRPERIVDHFKKSGGVVVWQTFQGSKAPEGLGEPAAKWVNEKGYGTFVFVSPDIHIAERQK